jgi:hypothetical protein
MENRYAIYGPFAALVLAGMLAGGTLYAAVKQDIPPLSSKGNDRAIREQTSREINAFLTPQQRKLENAMAER